MKEQLCQWYKENKRDLPWRKRHDPYAIWVSEIMLQQTQVATVIPYYERFMEAFPTYQELAYAPLETVYKYWEGLGYYRRAKHLHEAANQIIDEMNNVFPNTYQDIIKLKGVGPYTASAIASIAFLEPKGVVDGNVLRILSRYENNPSNIALDQTKKAIQEKVDKLIIGANPSDFNQALMDLGAIICKPKQPLCDRCPLQKQCQAYLHQTQHLLPISLKPLKKTEEHYLTVIIQNQDDEYFLIQNKQGLLENLYALPQYTLESPFAFEAQFEKDYHQKLHLYTFYKDFKHQFTHKTWYMHVYLGKLETNHHPHFHKLDDVPMPTAHKKILQSLKKDNL